jgi:hypothetical protein
MDLARNARPSARPAGGVGGAAGKKAAASSGEDSGSKKEIHLDGLAVLKIVKHAHEAPDTTGILLGLDMHDHLEITNCFPQLPAEVADERRRDRYTMEMLKLLREVKIDNYNIGWYQSCPLNSFATETFVRNQHSYQVETPGAAAIIYDPTSASLGSLYLKVCCCCRPLCLRWCGCFSWGCGGGGWSMNVGADGGADGHDGSGRG